MDGLMAISSLFLVSPPFGNRREPGRECRRHPASAIQASTIFLTFSAFAFSLGGLTSWVPDSVPELSA